MRQELETGMEEARRRKVEEKTCSQCEHYWPHPSDEQLMGTCREHSPLMTPHSTRAEWPRVLPDEGCSRWSPPFPWVNVKSESQREKP